MNREITFINVCPTNLIVKYKEDGTPYIWYEGEVTGPSGDKVKIVIPHLDLYFEEISCSETIDYDFEVHQSFIIPNQIVERKVECKPSKMNGEEIFFYIQKKFSQNDNFLF